MAIDNQEPAMSGIADEPGAEAREPGAFAGEIRIADDFDVLPDDIAREFGAAEN